jgi:hypothetical protein
MFEYICNGAVAKWSKAEASKASFVGSNPAGASSKHPDRIREVNLLIFPKADRSEAIMPLFY